MVGIREPPRAIGLRHYSSSIRKIGTKVKAAPVLDLHF
jgi:hypothetical protein